MGELNRYTRKEVLERLNKKRSEKKPIIASGAGAGLIGKVLDENGCDLIFSYCTGAFRMDGYMSHFGMLPFLDCDEDSVVFGNRLMRVVKNTPIICGIGAGSPTAHTEVLLESFIDGVGYAGVINVPIDPYYPERPGCTRGMFGERCSRDDAVLRKSVENISIAHKRDVFTSAYCFTDESIRMFGDAGCDMFIPHLGFTAGGTNGAVLDTSQTFFESEMERLARMVELCRSVNPDAICVVHGGVLADTDSIAKGIRASRADGYVGASGTERIPVEQGITQVMRELRAIRKR